MRVDVAFTPADLVDASTAVVVDVIRATSTIVEALAGGYERVFCCAEIDEAVGFRNARGEGVLGGERDAVPIPGFDLGNSPSEYTEPRGESVILTTTNGTRAIVASAGHCDQVLIGSLLNLDAVVDSVQTMSRDVVVVCAGKEGWFVLDDAYCAGRVAALLRGRRTDAAQAAIRIAESFPDPIEALSKSDSAANLRERGLEADIRWCARVGVHDVVPELNGMEGVAAELTLR